MDGGEEAERVPGIVVRGGFLVFVFKWKVEVMTRSIVEPPPSLASNPKEFYKIKNAYTHNPQSVQFLAKRNDQKRKEKGEGKRERRRTQTWAPNGYSPT